MRNFNFYKARKKELNLTNKKVSELSGLPLRTVEDFFRGAYNNPRIDTVEAIEKALNLSDEFTPEERAAGFTDKRKVSITPTEDDLLYVFREIGKRFGEQAQRDYITVGENMLKLK